MRNLLIPTLLSICLITSSGCGRGPRHLSAGDYEAGSTLLANLDKARDAYPTSGGFVWLETFSDAEQKITNPDLKRDLENYESVLVNRQALHNRMESNTYSVSDLSSAKKAVPASLLREREFIVARQKQLEALIPICHQDVDRWFDQATGSTGACASKLAAYNEETKLPLRED